MAVGVFIVRFAFLTLWFCVVCFFLNRPLQTASERHGFLPSSPCSSGTPELGASPLLTFYGVCLLLSLFFLSIAERLYLFFLIVGVSHDRCYGGALHS